MASLSINSLFNFFGEEKKSIERGENHYKSSHIESFSYHERIIRGQVHASMKKNVYKVTVYLDQNNEIKSTECECPRGEFKCSHAAAIFIHGIHNLSRTDIECEWKKRKAPECLKSAAEMYPKPKKYVAITRETTKEDRNALYEDLKSYGRFTGLFWIMSPEPIPPSLPIKTIESIIFSEEFLGIAGKEEQLSCLIKNSKLTEEDIVIVSNLTTGQRDNPAWHILRKGRLTASNFGLVLNAKRVTPSLIKRLLGEYDLSKVKAVTWGVNNENEAVKAFEQSTGLKVQDTGLWLDSSGVVGASPDGLIGRNSVLEVKCPYTHRNSTIAEALKSATFFLTKQDDGTVQLKKNHVYWHQVQGQMFLTGRMFCSFFVWTSKDFILISIKREESWANNIEIMKDFYFCTIFPKIVEGEL